MSVNIILGYSYDSILLVNKRSKCTEKEAVDTIDNVLLTTSKKYITFKIDHSELYILDSLNDLIEKHIPNYEFSLFIYEIYKDNLHSNRYLTTLRTEKK